MGVSISIEANLVVLSVEDDDAAYYLLEIAFREVLSSAKLYRAINGHEAMDFLQQSGRFADAPRPSLILCDLNLPKMGGLEVLTATKANPSLSSISVVVFTSSALDADRAKCMALGAKTFMTKSPDFDGFVHQVRSACALVAAA
jgi:CheY-like chemotaxis protein